MNERLIRLARLLFLLFCLVAGVRSASAFALLGPFAPWMTPQLAYQDGVSIGGPMDIDEGYRWNVPVITYGFDQSFLDFFGTNGVAAVESAIQILNDLPPASQIVLTNYSPFTSWVNYEAQSLNLIDLKTYALSMLVEHLGLAQPTRYIYCLHDFTISNGVPIYTVLNRNFDPDTWEPSTNVNGIDYDDRIVVNYDWDIFGSNILQFGTQFPLLPVRLVDAMEISIDPTKTDNSGDAVADSAPGGDETINQNGAGRYFWGLTSDDAGGLGYLLNSNNIALESLIPGVQGVGTNASNFVNTALRPGVEKITFQRMDYISTNQHVFPVITNQYVDSYFTNGVLQQQSLQRVISQPDILFTAKYIGLQTVSRSATTNWVNNGGQSADGPGVIQPPVVINFNQLGPSLSVPDPNYDTNSAQPELPLWGSYDGGTNSSIIIYPAASTNSCTQFHFILQGVFSNPFAPIPQTDYSWKLAGQPNALFSIQTSTNLQNWLTLGTITNIGGTFTYFDRTYTNTPQRFFRTVPQ
jgi:hypothetical protein